MITLVGNKLDLVENYSEKREISFEEAKSFAEENRLMFYESSALVNVKVDEAFEDLLKGRFKL